MSLKVLKVFLVCLTVTESLAMIWGRGVSPREEIDSDECDEPCFYLKDNETFSCENKGCSQLPDEIPEAVKMVMLESNRITELTRLSYLDLENITLSNNKISSIEELTFEVCKNIQFIDLSLNNIQNLTGKHLYIDNVDIQLSTLILSFNKITELTDNLFQHELHYSLLHLDISDNFIRKIGADTFKNLGKLKKLFLSTNNISHIQPNLFQNQFVLEELDLAENQILTILDNSFENLNHLLSLDLSNNKIYSVESDAFIGLEKLENLALAHNGITSLDPETFQHLTRLTDLHLDFNPIVSIYAETFPSSLVYLTMTGMTNLETIPARAFANCDQLLQVHLSENPRLREIAPDAFGGENSPLRRLTMKDNALTTISANLVRWENLIAIDLRGNQWSCDCNLRWMKTAQFPEWNKREIKCASPETLADQSIGEISEDSFQCDEGIPTDNKKLFRNSMIGLTTFTFVFAMIAFLFKCRYKVMPCWFAKPGKYFALYNVKDVDDTQITTNGYSEQGIVKHRSGTPAPVHV